MGLHPVHFALQANPADLIRAILASSPKKSPTPQSPNSPTEQPQASNTKAAPAKTKKQMAKRPSLKICNKDKKEKTKKKRNPPKLPNGTNFTALSQACRLFVQFQFSRACLTYRLVQNALSDHTKQPTKVPKLAPRQGQPLPHNTLPSPSLLCLLSS